MISQKMQTITIWIMVLCILSGAIILIYYYNDPSDCVLMPKCPFFLLTGLQCPSCGTQRALHALLLGYPMEALRYNFFMMFSIPYFLLVVVSSFAIKTTRRMIYLKSLYFILTHKFAILSYVALYFLWWILRNILKI